jgi:uncharacterized protein with HEPN domain
MRRDEAYLLDMLLAARQAIRFLEHLTQAQFETSDLHQTAVIRDLEIIGEAARLVSAEFRGAHPDIPWSQMIGMRNRLMHEYFRINLAAVWDTVQSDLPGLIAQLEPLIPREDEV